MIEDRKLKAETLLGWPSRAVFPPSQCVNGYSASLTKLNTRQVEPFA